MQIKIVSIGKIKETYLRDAISEYVKRLSSFCTLSIQEYSEEMISPNASPAQRVQAIEREGLILLKAAEGAGRLIALDPAGKEMETESFSTLIQRWEIDGPHHITFLIGGPCGISDQVRIKADILLSLSKMTFTHQIARILLLEQIYRSFTIIRGLPYHR